MPLPRPPCCFVVPPPGSQLKPNSRCTTNAYKTDLNLRRKSRGMLKSREKADSHEEGRTAQGLSSGHLE